jgi:hypothetical protein
LKRFRLEKDDLAGIAFETPADKDVVMKWNRQTLPCSIFPIRKQNQKVAMIPIPEVQWPL